MLGVRFLEVTTLQDRISHALVFGILVGHFI